VSVLAGAVAAFAWGAKAAAIAVAVILCLALGFWLTEMLIGVFTQTIKANPTAISLMLLGKFAWWAGLILAARHVPPGYEGAIGLGMGAFLLALSVAMIQHYGMPRISHGANGRTLASRRRAGSEAPRRHDSRESRDAIDEPTRLVASKPP